MTSDDPCGNVSKQHLVSIALLHVKMELLHQEFFSGFWFHAPVFCGQERWWFRECFAEFVCMFGASALHVLSLTRSVIFMSVEERAVWKLWSCRLLQVLRVVLWCCTFGWYVNRPRYFNLEVRYGVISWALIWAQSPGITMGWYVLVATAVCPHHDDCWQFLPSILRLFEICLGDFHLHACPVAEQGQHIFKVVSESLSG